MSNPGTDLNWLFRGPALTLLERILGQCDRAPESSTFGSFDRYHWCYKLHDLANARFQEAAQYLAMAAPLVDAWAREPLRKLAGAAISRWAAIRHGEGCVDEVYPNERSFCATAMSAQACSGAWLELDAPPKVDFTPTGRWLAANANPDLANQMAGACLALERMALISGRDQFRTAARKKFLAIAARQLPSGCYEEYGGEDLGYATITLALLAQYHRLRPDRDVEDSMLACAAWLDAKVGPDGLYDWKSTSRGTQFLYPSGLAYLGSPVLLKLAHGLRQGIALNPLWMDDRYCIPMAADYLLAARILEETGA
jgi:hypothetical protein